MGVRENLLDMKQALRTAIYAGSMGSPGSAMNVITSQLTVLLQQWSGGARDKGVANVLSSLTLPPIYPIRLVTVEEVEESGGRFKVGDVKVTHITPFDGVSTGYTAAQLNPVIPPGSVGMERIYRIAALQPAGISGDYELRAGQFDRTFSYYLVLQNLVTTP